jgi:PadR family transcriptional regulator PadR
MTARDMTEQAFFVLTTLTGGPLHGYGIMGEAASLSDGRVNLRVGTLYGVLDRLATEGLVELDHEEVQNGRLRRYYRMTGAGRQALASEAQRQSANARIAVRRLNELGGAAFGGAS